LEDDIIEEKRRLNQEIITKARNISVKLKKIDFKLVPFISPKLLED
jgi:hypothetical protein